MTVIIEYDMTNKHYEKEIEITAEQYVKWYINKETSDIFPKGSSNHYLQGILNPQNVTELHDYWFY